MANDRHRVEEMQAGSQRILRHLDRLIDEMLSTAAAHTRGQAPVSSVATVPDSDDPDAPVNSL